MGRTLNSADRYLRWWAPVLAPAALRLLDLIEDALPGRVGTVALVAKPRHRADSRS
jgi:hypothetical protein